MNTVQVGVFQCRLTALRIRWQVFRDDAGADAVSSVDFGDDLTAVRERIAGLRAVDGDMVLRLRDELRRRSVKENQTVVDHKHPVADGLHVLDNVCGEQDDLVLCHSPRKCCGI